MCAREGSECFYDGFGKTMRVSRRDVMQAKEGIEAVLRCDIILEASSAGCVQVSEEKVL